MLKSRKNGSLSLSRMPAAKKAIVTVGRRKSAIARVKLSSGEGSLLINGRQAQEYFPIPSLHHTLTSAQNLVKAAEKVNIAIRVTGGGLTGQVEACRLGIARALQLQNSTYRSPLKKAGFLRRDSRVVERKKYGLHKARRGTQFSKR